ncbi:DUF5818 domain-containing protein [Aquabacter sp. P-9]|uniref:DUF5818 domain-containing protein n=1 Tax=Aquabacter sediminis TaxID=3029197 RepID=UPI00237E4AEF|nr:DUF5818 domain-containing protein [Aquabacter sp. P-9]MDE1567098.1 DUF5818 domain-containing protein [Aquabacter sp. P-9]
MTGHGHSRGQEIDATGTLERGAHSPVLVLDGGGRWRLEASWRARKWLGKRVRVVGRRVEFDLIEVDSISAAGASGSRKPCS